MTSENTGSRPAERSVHEAELRIASTAFETHLGIMITDARGVILRANRAFTRITGYSEEDVALYNNLWSLSILSSSGRLTMPAVMKWATWC
jgi:PAS domain-containing protein